MSPLSFNRVCLKNLTCFRLRQGGIRVVENIGKEELGMLAQILNLLPCDGLDLDKLGSISRYIFVN